MKYPNSKIQFTNQRDRELLQAFRRIADCCGYVDLDEVSEQIADTPCSRFWVSEERAWNVVSNIMRGNTHVLDSMRPHRREMFEEIYRRVDELRNSQPDAPLRDLVFIAVNSPSPKFYMTPLSIKIILYNIKRLRRQQLTNKTTRL